MYKNTQTRLEINIGFSNVQKLQWQKVTELLFSGGELGIKNEKKYWKGKRNNSQRRNQKSIQKWPGITHKPRLKGQIKVFILK